MEQVINTNIYKIRVQNTTNILQKQYHKSSLNSKNSSTE